MFEFIKVYVQEMHSAGRFSTDCAENLLNTGWLLATAYLEQWPEATFDYMQKWHKHEPWHVELID